MMNTLPPVCTNVTSEHMLRRSFLPEGRVHSLLACAVQRDARFALYAGLLNPSTLKTFLCGPPPNPLPPEPPAAVFFPEAVVPVAVAVVVLLGIACWAVVRGGWQRRRGHILAWWVALAVACGPTASNVDRRVDVNDFIVRDRVTECAFQVTDIVPGVVAKDHSFTVISPAAAAVDALDRVLRTPIITERGPTTLYEECGMCGLTAWNRSEMPSPSLVRTLILTDTPAVHGEVAFSLQLPPSMDDASRTSFVRGLDVGSDDVLFANVQQTMIDSEVSAQPDLWIVAASAGLLFAFAEGGARAYVTAGSVTLTTCAVFLLGISVVVSTAITSLTRVPPSPFNMLAFPLVLGTGVDSLFLFLHQRSRHGRRWVGRTLPSVAASQLSTLATFLVGVVVDIPHVRYFFVFMAICVVVSFALQVTALPAAIVLCSRARVPPREQARPSSSRTTWRLAAPIVATVALWCVVLLYHQPVGRRFDLRTQLREDTMTHRFMAAMDGVMESPMALVYALTDGFDNGAEWSTVDETALGWDCTTGMRSMSWHAQMPPGVHLREWLNDTRVRYTVQPFLNAAAESSVALFVSDFDMGVDAVRSFDELTCMARHSTDRTCFASFERLGGYTVVKIVNHLRWLAAVSCVLCTAIGGVVLRGRGILALLALALSYGGVVGVMSMSGIPIDMLLVAVMLIAPGLVVDYTLHLLFHRDATLAVLLSSASSVASALPYLAMPVEGIRYFVVVYALFLVLGVLHAFALTATTELVVAYHTVRTAEEEESCKSRSTLESPKSTLANEQQPPLLRA